MRKALHSMGLVCDSASDGTLVYNSDFTRHGMHCSPCPTARVCCCEMNERQRQLGNQCCTHDLEVINSLDRHYHHLVCIYSAQIHGPTWYALVARPELEWHIETCMLRYRLYCRALFGFNHERRLMKICRMTELHNTCTETDWFPRDSIIIVIELSNRVLVPPQRTHSMER